MRRRFIAIPAALALAFALAPLVAGAHACTEDPDTGAETCEDTPVQPNWRDGNYVPLFDLEDRDDEQQRKDAQRWREECDGQQQCAWVYGGQSVVPNRDGRPQSPNELHAGYAASHCFLAEAAHQCEDHEAQRGEGVHDAHGGALYVDICLTANPDSKYCDDGLEDTQAGVTIMDHNACGTIIPIVACTDEYHVIRPFDTEYTAEQMNDSAAYIPRIVEDPILYLCGKPQYRAGNPPCTRDAAGMGPGTVTEWIAAGYAPELVRAAAADPGMARRLSAAGVDMGALTRAAAAEGTTSPFGLGLLALGLAALFGARMRRAIALR